MITATRPPKQQLRVLVVLISLLLLWYYCLSLRYRLYEVKVPSEPPATDSWSLIIEHPNAGDQVSKGEEKLDISGIKVWSEDSEDTVKEGHDNGLSENPQSPVAEIVQEIQDAAKEGPTTNSSESKWTSFPLISDLDYSQTILESSDKKYPYAIIVAHTDEEDIDWIDAALRSDPLQTKAMYNVKSPQAPYAVPTNKGHEVMAYLTYIIDFYDTLPPINIFMHAHDNGWHNNFLLESSNAQTLKYLNFNKIMRDGYMNLRCQIEGDCPGHLSPLTPNHSSGVVSEERAFAKAWAEILPAEPVPEAVSQACCGQFAVTSQRIHLLPKRQYEYFREWLRDTKLTDHISGRIWEYIYQYIWAGQPEFCPSASVCLCDGFGLCFGGEERYEVVARKSREWSSEKENQKKGREFDEEKLRELDAFIQGEKERAMERGRDERLRADEVGRVGWKVGDGI